MLYICEYIFLKVTCGVCRCFLPTTNNTNIQTPYEVVYLHGTGASHKKISQRSKLRNRRTMKDKKKESKKQRGGASSEGSSAHKGGLHKQAEEGWAFVDPNRVRYQHSRIRPYFSGCGRSVEQTLNDIRNGKMSPNELPPIQVIVGHAVESGGCGEPWYFSLNNRRLWVLKECRKEGLLEKQNNAIQVRVRPFKCKKEQERYTLLNCSLEATFLREKAPRMDAATSVMIPPVRTNPILDGEETTAPTLE